MGNGEKLSVIDGEGERKGKERNWEGATERGKQR